MADVEVKFDRRKLKNLQRIFKDFPRTVPKIMSRAINRTTTTARAQIARKIAEKITIKISDVKKSISQTKATYNRWISIIGINTKRLPLMKFKARQTAKGVSYKIEKTGSPKILQSAFITTMASGHTGVFRRKSDNRLPIVELFGPSLGQVFEGASQIVRQVKESCNKNLSKNIDSQVKLQLEKRRA